MNKVDREALRNMEKKQKKTVKGTMFSKCQIPSELFHINRLVKNKIKAVTGRLGYLMLRDGTIEIKGDNIPQLADNTREVVVDLEEEYKLTAFSKPDYFVSAALVDGLISSQEFSKKGMQIHCLNSRMLYPMYGVYMPTAQEYLNLFNNYL